MKLVKIEGGAVVKYPYSLSQLRADNPNVSFPRTIPPLRLAEHGCAVVEETAEPAVTLAQNAVEGTPVLVGGVWKQVWNVVDASPDEIAQREAEAAVVAARAEIKADAFVQQFVNMTPAQVANYINNNVTDLPSAKGVLTKLALIVLLLARREFK